MKKILWLVILGIVLGACAAKPKTPVAESVEKKTSSDHSVFYRSILKKSDFDAIKITSKIDVLGVPSINATIYIENNQKIWMNFTALFINVARGMATPEGLKMYERIDKTYIDSDFSYLNNLLNINFLDYNSLQNLLVGKAFVPINEQKFSLVQNENDYRLISKENQKILVEGEEREYASELQFSPDFDLMKVVLTEVKSSDQLQIFYNDWVAINQQKLPQNVKIIIKGKKNREILIENTKFEFSTMETPYRVPDNYKKRKL
ncbi:MAG: DUF4292 domain-containing protein [Flavobacteriaceae bacterium]|nr:DUF4292 domain-containing protein [Flavobacteriaceae bacterium]